MNSKTLLKGLTMRGMVIALIFMALLAFALTGCAASKRNHSELRGLMLLENTQLKSNKAYYSKHNIKTKKDAYRKYRRNNRHG